MDLKHPDLKRILARSTKRELVLAPRPFDSFTPQAFHDYVKSLYYVPVDSSRAPVEGLSVSRTKSGKLSVRKSKSRAFNYILEAELELMAERYSVDPTELRRAFIERKFHITTTRIEAERLLLAPRTEP
jgi:hypothetical protein